MSFILKFDPDTGVVLGTRPSANTPDYEGRSGFLINPDMSPVKDVPRERWRVKNGVLTVAPTSEPLMLSAESTAYGPLPALALEHTGSLLSDSLQLLEKSSDPALMLLAYPLRFFQNNTPVLFEVISDVLIETLFSIIPGTGGIPRLWQTPIERKRTKYLAELLSHVVEHIEQVENRLEQLESETGIELGTRLLDRAARAADERELDAAKKVFRYLAIGGVDIESSEITQSILELRTLHLLVLRDVGYWTEHYDDPTKEQLLPKGIAESLGMDESIVYAAIGKLVSLGFLHGSSPRAGYASEYLQIALSRLGRKSIEILDV